MPRRSTTTAPATDLFESPTVPSMLALRVWAIQLDNGSYQPAIGFLAGKDNIIAAFKRMKPCLNKEIALAVGRAERVRLETAMRDSLMNEGWQQFGQ